MMGEKIGVFSDEEFNGMINFWIGITLMNLCCHLFIFYGQNLSPPYLKFA